VGFARRSRLRLSAPTAGREEEQAQAKAPAYTAGQLRLGSQQSLSRPPHTQVIVYTIDHRQRRRLFGSPPEQKRPRRARASCADTGGRFRGPLTSEIQARGHLDQPRSVHRTGNQAKSTSGGRQAVTQSSIRVAPA